MKLFSPTLFLATLSFAYAAQLPDSPGLNAFYQFVATTDFADEKIELEPKQGDGSSAYFKIKIESKTWGAILPENTSTSVFGEIFSFNLARALGHPELSSPGALCILKGKALARFTAAMRAAKFTSPERQDNQAMILQRIENNPDSLETVVKIWGPKPYAYDDITTPEDKLNGNDPFARLLKADQPQPTTRLVALPGIPGQARESDLARQLSTMFLIDALAGQADRFSKGNVTAIEQNGVVSFVALDNGGTWDKGEWLDLYLGWVTRFDAKVAERILAMNDFLAGAQPQFLGFTTEADFQKAMGLATEPEYWGTFKQRLAFVAAHIRAQKGDCYFSP